MRSVQEWDEDYVINQIPPGEHDWVEFKGRAGLDLSLPAVKADEVLKVLAKEVSAFANSGGGTIVYGIVNAQAGKERSVDDGGISLDIKNGTKEWLEDVIPTLVEFPLPKFNVYAITKDHGGRTVGDGRSIILIEVPDSEAAPHQSVRDQRYYARVGGKSKPIGHRMVTDITGRAKHPKMEVSLRFEAERGPLAELIVRCQNIGRVYANYVVGFVMLPVELSSLRGGETIVEDGGRKFLRLRFQNLHHDVVNSKISGGFETFSVNTNTVTRYDPVLPQLSFGKAFSVRVDVAAIARHGEAVLSWEVYADNGPACRGSVRVADVPITGQFAHD
jgi:hypothetical protein